jgi:hypothetical protein
LRVKSYRRRLRSPFLLAVAAAPTFLLYQLVATLIEELPRLFMRLK